MLAKQYRSSFACKNGITNAFLCSFYRVATLGSGSGVAAIIYLGEQGIEYGGGFGLYMIQYALHKMSIALFSAILFVMNWEFMKSWFGDYAGLLAGGYAVTFVITIGLFLFCCSKKFHRLIFRLLDIVNQKFHGRFEIMEAEIKRQCMMLEDASKHLLKNKKATTGVIFLCLLKCCFWYGIPYLLFKGVQFQGNPALTLSQVLAITSLSVMLAAVIPSPAGIGSTEFLPESSARAWRGQHRFCTALAHLYFHFWWEPLSCLSGILEEKKYLVTAYEKISCNLKVNIVI